MVSCANKFISTIVCVEGKKFGQVTRSQSLNGCKLIAKKKDLISLTNCFLETDFDWQEFVASLNCCILIHI